MSIDEVWTKSRQQGLIDSLFKGCPIPAIVLAAKKKPDGTEYFNVIDGKQRLTTIARFMSGKVRPPLVACCTVLDVCPQLACAYVRSLLSRGMG
jgi:hypothetical protein